MPTFQPTLPARGATNAYPLFFPTLAYFNPRSPHGERRFAGTNTGKRPLISTHAPRTGSDPEVAGTHRIRADISTHAPRTGSDEQDDFRHPSECAISTHAPRTGSDATRSNSSLPTRNFNPRSPHGERRCPHSISLVTAHNFNPRSPHGERPTAPLRLERPFQISTHAPRTGSDCLRCCLR